MPAEPILVVNTGSSSLKLGLYVERKGDESLVFDGLADGIGQSSGTLVLRDDQGRTVRSDRLVSSTQDSAFQEVVGWLREVSRDEPRAIGHRIVHGGPHLVTHQIITPQVLAELQRCVHFAPLHIPMSLELIKEATRAYPGVPQFACFDTSFHRTLPEAASRFALPRELFDKGIRRYGFHGLSYESIVHALGAELRSRTAMAHLGGGSSLAAIRDGRSVDTSMGLTPTGGVPMATRSGDLDPGVLLFLMSAHQAAPDSLEGMLNKESGLKAISAGEADMRALEKAGAAGDQPAELAIEIFSTAIAKYIAGYAVVLGGLEMVVFAGGIGEHSAVVRREVCRRLGFLGIALDEGRNQQNSGTISTETSAVVLRIVPSEEDRQIARHTRRLMRDA